jgi:hypothetical protein
MSRALLNPKTAQHLARICGMFGSDHDGERAAAARLADQHIKRLGLSWRQVIRVEAHWRTMAREERSSEFNEQERQFITNMTTRLRWRAPTDRQLSWLEALFERIDPDDFGRDP